MLILFLIYFALCLGIGYLGVGRKMGFWGYFFFALFFSPILALLLVLVSDKRPEAPSPASSDKVAELIASNTLLRADVTRVLEENKRLLDRLDKSTPP
ncbi:MAG TPA: hypothetical protein VFS10_05325 [Pyrinomonadaceae bacterium]|nr:hypothetical protein [Pyrinomonadaceae bacterium]